MKKAYPSKLQDSELRPGQSSRAELELLRDKVSELVQKSPEKAAIILTDWLKKPASNTKKKTA